MVTKILPIEALHHSLSTGRPTKPNSEAGSSRKKYTIITCASRLNLRVSVRTARRSWTQKEEVTILLTTSRPKLSKMEISGELLRVSHMQKIRVGHMLPFRCFQ
jgi:hypothetical protein